MDTFGFVPVAVFFILLLHRIFQRSATKSNRLPPGPWRLPLIGSLLYMAKYRSKLRHEMFAELTKKYGPIFYLRRGVTDIVVVNGYDSVKNVLTNDAWLERTDAKMNLMRHAGKRQGLMFGHLNLWKASRKFVLRNLRDFGFGKKNTMKMFIDREVEDIQCDLDEIIEEDGGRFSPTHFFGVPLVNVVWALVTGSRYSHSDPQIRKLVANVFQVNQVMSFSRGFLMAYPQLAEIFPESWLGLAKYRRIMRVLPKHMEELVEETRRKGTYKTNPENLIEIYLAEIDKTRDDPTLNHDAFSDENLVAILTDLFNGGAKTTSHALECAILWLTMNQHVQKKFRDEVIQFSKVHGRQPGLADMNSLPYVRATILEIHRRSALAPVAPRKVFQDTPLNDYIIPGGSIVLVNLHSVMMDPDYWGDPENFRPERFLDSTNQIVNISRVVPFSLGKRCCVGEVLAEAAIFLLTTFLFSTYEFLPSSEDHVYDASLIEGVVMSPKPFSVRIKRV